MSEDFNHFPGIAAVIHEACAQVVTKTALDAQKNIQTQIQANGQVDTGFMLNSVHTEDGESDLEKYVIVGASYGVYQNYGTRHLPARPFFEPGLDKTRPGFEAAMDAIRARMESV